MITQDLGIATAYGYAKSKGYTGTEAEFAELMASYAEVGQTAVDAAQAALASKNAAQTAATTATNKATEATTAATTATTKAGEASTSASTATSAKDTAVSASQTATTKATEATTAAATAVSAKDDAVSANTAAQSAKTAAQTAQTGAETAAASVQSSAAQIATNAADISQLKSDLATAVGSTFNLSAGYYNSSGVVVSNNNYRHTDVLNESFIREDFNITPNSVGVWNNGVYTLKYWSQRSQLTTFDSIVYNFQTPHTTVVCISDSYLSNKVSSLDSDLSIEKTKTGQEFTLTQGYYNASGVLVDNSALGCTEKLLETTIRRGFIPTPHSVVAWKNGTPVLRDWANVDQITSFDTIVYNFQTTERKAYDLTPSYLSKQVEQLKNYADGIMDFAGKKVAIIGDSISTNGDYSAQNPYGNVPEIIIETADVGVTLQAYPTYYDIGVTVGGHKITLSDVGSELTFTPTADDVGKMVGKPLSYNPTSTIVWWEILQQQLGIEPIPVCWSGASITSHNNDENNLKTSHAWHDATIRKCGIRIAGTMDRVAPDIVIIYRGTNDFSHVPYVRITNNYYDSVPWRYPDTDVITDGYGYLQGLCLTVKKLRTAYPNAIIFLCTMNTFKRVDDSLFAIDNDRNTLPQYSKAIRETADFLGCNVINFDKDGITYENCYSEGYITDSASHPTHPSNKGHKVMGNRALLDLVTQCNSIT